MPPMISVIALSTSPSRMIVPVSVPPSRSITSVVVIVRELPPLIAVDPAAARNSSLPRSSVTAPPLVLPSVSLLTKPPVPSSVTVPADVTLKVPSLTTLPMLAPPATSTVRLLSSSPVMAEDDPSARTPESLVTSPSTVPLTFAAATAAASCSPPPVVRVVPPSTVNDPVSTSMTPVTSASPSTTVDAVPAVFWVQVPVMSPASVAIPWLITSAVMFASTSSAPVLVIS